MLDPTLWNLEPHTQGKHEVLRGYLDAWFPIMGRRNGRILYIDGFAGPGQYAGGEDGSPVIAMRSLLDHSVQISSEVGFLFIERRTDRFDHLETVIEPLRGRLLPPSWARCVHGLFDERLTEVLDQVDAQARNLAPSFVMIDPFGVSGLPMNVIARILQNPQSEIYVSFMYESINRFRSTPEFEGNLDELFGTRDWRAGIDMPESNERRRFFFDLYEAQLRRAGARQVLHFELYEGNRLIYAIFFGTQHLLGCDRMKQAIWRVAPWGDFAFRPVRIPQMTLGIETPDFPLFQNQIAQELAGGGWVRVDELEEFAQSDRTPFHTGHLRRGALVPMETAGRIEIDPLSRRRTGSHPPGTRIRIAQ